MIGIDYVQQKNNKNLVIFVHGFTGSKETWKNLKEEYFPEMLLKNEEIKNNFDIAYFNYYTKFIEPFSKKIGSMLLNKLFSNGSKKIRKNLSINDIADYMGSVIRTNCDNYDNIIIIAHSMGGLISKAFIINELKEYGETKVRLFLSLAVPHFGTNLANLAKIINIKNIQVNDLAVLNDTTTTLSRDWLNTKHPNSVYFIGKYDEVVEKNSGIPFDTNKLEIIHCEDTHISISKPASDMELVFQSVQKKLVEFIRDQNTYKNMRIKKFNDDGSLDDELFVIKLIVADIDRVLINGAKQNFFNAEYVTRMFNRKQQECLEELYFKIKDLYVIYYGKFVSNDIKSSNEFLTKIHEKIREDNQLNISNEEHKKLFSLISYIHKTGMLHQLANKKDEDIFWKENCAEDINKFIKGNMSNE